MARIEYSETSQCEQPENVNTLDTWAPPLTNTLSRAFPDPSWKQPIKYGHSIMPVMFPFPTNDLIPNFTLTAGMGK